MGTEAMTDLLWFLPLAAVVARVLWEAWHGDKDARIVVVSMFVLFTILSTLIGLVKILQ